ncbi:MAG TPA: hypothetical protein VGH39_11750 [Xanthobacteraceae bacterium]|jgi:hypothetical protein
MGSKVELAKPKVAKAIYSPQYRSDNNGGNPCTAAAALKASYSVQVSREGGVRAPAALILGLVLSGCGLGSMQDARNEYQKSTDKYNACVAASPGMPQRCETLRLAMEADGYKYNEVSPNLLDKLMPGGDKEKPAGKYSECLAANPGAAEKCDALRVAMEAEQRKPDKGFTLRPGTPPPDFANANY